MARTEDGAVEFTSTVDVDGKLHALGDFLTDGLISNPGGIKIQSSDLTKNANTTFADAAGLSVSLAAGKTYVVHAVLYVTVDANAGAKFQFGGTCTLTSGIAQITGISNTNNNLVFAIKSTPKTLGGQQSGASGTDWTVMVDATIVVNAAGTLTIQFAQQVSFAGNCIMKAQSMMEVMQAV